MSKAAIAPITLTEEGPIYNPLEVEGSAGVVSDSDFREYSGMERGVLIVRRILQISPLKRLRSGLFSVHIRVTHTTAWQH